jgi:hypothetical protein
MSGNKRSKKAQKGTPKEKGRYVQNLEWCISSDGDYLAWSPDSPRDIKMKVEICSVKVDSSKSPADLDKGYKLALNLGSVVTLFFLSI